MPLPMPNPKPKMIEPRVDMITPEIPKRCANVNWRFKDIPVGGSFEYIGATKAAADMALKRWMDKSDPLFRGTMTFVTRKTPGGVRVWRIV